MGPGLCLAGGQAPRCLLGNLPSGSQPRPAFSSSHLPVGAWPQGGQGQGPFALCLGAWQPSCPGLAGRPARDVDREPVSCPLARGCRQQEVGHPSRGPGVVRPGIGPQEGVPATSHLGERGSSGVAPGPQAAREAAACGQGPLQEGPRSSGWRHGLCVARLSPQTLAGPRRALTWAGKRKRPRQGPFSVGVGVCRGARPPVGTGGLHGCRPGWFSEDTARVTEEVVEGQVGVRNVLTCAGKVCGSCQDHRFREGDSMSGGGLGGRQGGRWVGRGASG